MIGRLLLSWWRLTTPPPTPSAIAGAHRLAGAPRPAHKPETGAPEIQVRVRVTHANGHTHEAWISLPALDLAMTRASTAEVAA